MEDNTFENDVVVETEEVQPEVQQPAEKKLDVKEIANDVVAKAKDLIENRGVILEKIKAIPRKIWIMAGAGVLVLVAAIVAVSLLSNTYKTPITAAEQLLNMKSVDKIVNNAPSILNGFGENEAEKMIKIIKKSDQYQDVKEDAEDALDTVIENLKDMYGDNYKIKIKVEDKEELEKEDNKAFREQLRSIGDMTEDLDDLDSDDYEDMADSIGITKAQAKELVKTLKAFCKECKTAKVSKGYELSLVVSITGSELDEPQEMDFTLRVFQVDGRWVPDVFSLVRMIGIGNLLSLVGSL